MEEIDCSILWEQFHSSHLMRLWRTGACVLHYKAAEDVEDFDVSVNEFDVSVNETNCMQLNYICNFTQETSLMLKDGEYALSSDITVCLWLKYRSLKGSTPLRDVSGGDFVIVNVHQ